MFRALVLAAVIFATHIPCAAASEKVIPVRLGTKSTFEVPANGTTRKVSWVFFSKNKKPTSLDFTVSGPAKTVISLKAVGVRSSTTIDQAVSLATRNSYPIEIHNSSGRSKKSISIGASSSGGGGGSNWLCDGMIDPSYYPALLQIFRDAFGRDPVSMDEFCQAMVPGWNGGNSGGGTGGGSTAAGSASGVSHILKDLCTAGFKYLVLVTADLSRVSAEDRAAGFTLQFDGNEELYSGDDNIKIKAIGAGMYREPLGMASLLGAGYHMIAKTRRTGGALRISSVQRFKIAKTYADGIRGALEISRIRKGLTGGRGSFFAANPQNVFGACINLVARDQYYNGYPR